MAGAVDLPGAGRATSCQLARYHRPLPLRYVWHHILPEACGGRTEPGNLAQVCDSCHYSVHMLLWWLANGGIPAGITGSRAQLLLARRGYTLAQAAGTADRIPKEA
jgi:HNH endonuclease